MYRCAHCGNEYEEKKEQCPTCGGRILVEMAPAGFLILDANDEFRVLPRPLPLREIYKGQTPLPKPLPSLRRLQPDDSLIYKPFDDTLSWPWLVLLCALMLALPIIMFFMWTRGGG